MFNPSRWAARALNQWIRNHHTSIEEYVGQQILPVTDRFETFEDHLEEHRRDINELTNNQLEIIIDLGDTCIRAKARLGPIIHPGTPEVYSSRERIHILERLINSLSREVTMVKGEVYDLTPAGLAKKASR